jgi:hypothetical protein
MLIELFSPGDVFHAAECSMSNRGNKRPGFAAKVIFALIAVIAIAVVWLGIVGIGKEPHVPPRGSQALPVRSAGAQLSPAQPK